MGLPSSLACTGPPIAATHPAASAFRSTLLFGVPMPIEKSGDAVASVTTSGRRAFRSATIASSFGASMTTSPMSGSRRTTMSTTVSASSRCAGRADGPTVTAMRTCRSLGSTPRSRNWATVRLAELPTRSWSFGTMDSITPPG